MLGKNLHLFRVALLAATISGPSFAAEKDTLVAVRESEPTTLDYKDISHQPDTFMAAQVMQPLVTYDVVAKKVVGHLATSWEWDGDRTWTFQLKEGVTFHDGDTFDSADVVHTFQRIMDPANTALAAHHLTEVDSISATGKHTVEIKTKKKDAAFDRRLYNTFIGSDSNEPELFVNQMNGTGPYKLVEWSRGRHVKLTRFDAWVGDKPAIKDVTILFRSEPSVRANMVKNGEADFAWLVAPEDADGAPQKFIQDLKTIIWLRPNTLTNPALKDLRVRQAMLHAVDAKTLAQTLLKDVAIPVEGNQNVPSGATGYLEGEPVWEFDVEKAKALIEEAKAAGTDVEVPLVIAQRGTGQFPRDSELAEYLVGAWRAIGLTGAEVQIYDTQTWIEGYRAIDPSATLFDLTYGNGDNPLMDYSHISDRYMKCGGSVSHFCDPKADELYAKAAGLLGEERDAAYQEAAKYLGDKVPMLNIGRGTGIHVAAKGLKWTPGSPPDPDFWNMSWEQ